MRAPRLWVPLGALVLGSLIGLFYYLRVIAALFTSPERPAAPRPLRRAAWPALALLSLAVLALGVWPGPLIDLIQGLTGSGVLSEVTATLPVP